MMPAPETSVRTLLLLVGGAAIPLLLLLRGVAFLRLLWVVLPSSIILSEKEKEKGKRKKEKGKRKKEKGKRKRSDIKLYSLHLPV